MVCLRCPHTLGHSWEKTILDSRHVPTARFALRHLWEGHGMEPHWPSLHFPASVPSFFLINRSLPWHNCATNWQPFRWDQVRSGWYGHRRKPFKYCFKKNGCFCSSEHQIMSLTNIFIEVAIGLTCFQIDFFFVFCHHAEISPLI